MRGNFHVLLDACVLGSYSTCDLLLRLAETPRLFSPHWSAKILDEACNHYATRRKKPWPLERVASFRSVLEEHFPEALVSDYDHLEPSLTNHSKDRHVLAAAIHAKAQHIVTFNLKDFQAEHLARWEMAAVHPSEFLVTLYDIDPGVVVSKLNSMAMARKLEPVAMVRRLNKCVPTFAAHVANALGWNLEEPQGGAS